MKKLKYLKLKLNNAYNSPIYINSECIKDLKVFNKKNNYILAYKSFELVLEKEMLNEFVINKLSQAKILYEVHENYDNRTSKQYLIDRINSIHNFYFEGDEAKIIVG